MVYYCTLLVGCGRVPEEIFQTESCEESTDDIEDVNEILWMMKLTVQRVLLILGIIVPLFSLTMS